MHKTSAGYRNFVRIERDAVDAKRMAGSLSFLGEERGQTPKGVPAMDNRDKLRKLAGELDAATLAELLDYVEWSFGDPPQRRSTATPRRPHDLAPEYPLATERLLLRPFEPQDRDPLVDMLSRPEVVQYLYTPVQGPAEIAQTLPARMGRTAIHQPGDALHLAVELKQPEPQFVGDVSLQWIPDEHRQGEIGFVFHPDFHGHGYATEAARLMVDLGFQQLGLHRIVGRLEARNHASARVLRRIGMRLEAHFRENEWVKDEWQSEKVYAVLRRDWEQRQRQARSGA